MTLLTLVLSVLALTTDHTGSLIVNGTDSTGTKTDGTGTGTDSTGSCTSPTHEFHMGSNKLPENSEQSRLLQKIRKK